MEDKSSAIDEFIALYEEKTGNLWKDRKNFKKKPGKFYPLDIDYGEVFELSAIKSKFLLVVPKTLDFLLSGLVFFSFRLNQPSLYRVPIRNRSFTNLCKI